MDNFECTFAPDGNSFTYSATRISLGKCEAFSRTCNNKVHKSKNNKIVDDYMCCEDRKCKTGHTFTSNTDETCRKCSNLEKEKMNVNIF